MPAPVAVRRPFPLAVAIALALSTTQAWSQTPAGTTDTGRAGTFKQVQGEIRLGTDAGRPAPTPVRDFRRILDDRSVDALVNVAAFEYVFGGLHETKDDDWRKAFELSLIHI